ncbi:MAG: glycoside hydrolase family 172 protein, partial [Bryobacteraceae bacterium]
PLVADDIANLWRLRNYTSHRISSADSAGDNLDGDQKHPIKPGETRLMGEVQGPGIVKHIWIAFPSNEAYHLKRYVLRMYWDGEALPAVEAPLGDFFGLGLGEYVVYEAGPISVGSLKAMNSFFPMPFRKSARFTITNEGEQPIGAFYYNIDWEKHTSLPSDLSYFHAEYRQAVPNKSDTNDWKLNRDVDKMQNPKGERNYVFVETEGRGHFVGVTLSVLQNQGDWWGEGDEMIFIDDRSTPRIIGTGSEDYFLGAWCYGGCGLSPFGTTHPTFSFQRYGNPINGGDMRGSRWMLYRFHTDSPVAFQEYFKMTIEHGHANHRADNFYSVAYWYQVGPHRKRQPLPPVAERIPRMINTKGPTVGRP